MIISKASLGVVELCRADKQVPILWMVCFEPDGTVIATNGKVVCAVSPVQKRIADAVPLASKGMLLGQVLLSADSVRELIKAIPRDTQFKGLLEHCAVEVMNSAQIKVQITDGKSKREMMLRQSARAYLPYRKVFIEAWANVINGSDGKVVMNRKRMALAMTAIDKVCPYDGDFSPVYWQFTRQGNVIVRAENEITGQRLCAVFSSVDIYGQESAGWLELNDWERKLLRRGAMKL
jgi:hypothetical protein